MRLLLVELTRLRWRRAVLALVALSILIPAFVAWGEIHNTRPYSQSEIDQAISRVKADVGQDKYFERNVRQCAKHPERFGIDAPAGGDATAPCEAQMLRDYAGLYREDLDLKQVKGQSGVGVIVVLAGLAMLIGATFVGADWASGSMSNQLLFESRRLRVYAAKAAAVLLVGLVLSLVVLSLWWTVLGQVAAHRDLTTSAATWADIRGAVVRGSLLAALAGVGGYAMTMLFRSTVATLGVLFGTVVATTLLIASLPLENAQRWLPSNNIGAWVLDGIDYYTNNTQEHLSKWDGGLYLLVLLVAALLLSSWSFRRRDVP
jgi:ABC-type transport system involved in multi-copper enzyme maturation permease subunit